MQQSHRGSSETCDRLKNYMGRHQIVTYPNAKNP